MLRPGLRWEIVFALTVVMVAASFLIGAVVLNVTKQSIIDQQVKGAGTLISVLQHSIDSICYGSDQVFLGKETNWQLQRLVRLCSLEEEVGTVLVTDRNGLVLASSEPEQVGTTVRDKDLLQVMHSPALACRNPQTPQVLLHRAGGELLLSAPFCLKDQVVGAIRMSLSLAQVQRAINRSFRLIVSYIIFTSLVIILFGWFLFSRFILKPIRKLVAATESIAQGEYRLSLAEENRNEIGQLAFAFRRMADRIDEHQKKLEQQIQALETLNRELQQSQREVLASEKLAMVGKLAAGIAHEIGNPLSAILGYISLLQKQGAYSGETHDYLLRMEKELNRINNTIRGLLDFSRLQKVEIATIAVKELLEDSLGLVTHQKQFDDIIVVFHAEEDLWPAKADAQQLTQVILNLLLNAGEAIRGKGEVMVAADRVISRANALRPFAPRLREAWSPRVPDFGLWAEEVVLEHPAVEANMPLVRIVVADNGEGISAENLPKVFDPFFTTRQPGKGTGLGLAVCARIIESCGGALLVRSRAGEGSAFLILLPAEG